MNSTRYHKAIAAPYLLLVTLLLLLTARASARAQEELPRDAQQVISQFTARGVSGSADTIKRLTSQLEFDARKTGEIESLYRQHFKDSVVSDRAILDNFQALIAPVLRFYSLLPQQYRFLLVANEVPFSFSEGHVVIITTGLIKRVKSVDALLGVVAHEVGHGLFLEESQELERSLELAQSDSNLARAQTLARKLVLIEYKCDLVAAVVLSALGLNPQRYAELLEDLPIKLVQSGDRLQVVLVRPDQVDPEFKRQREERVAVIRAVPIRAVPSNAPVPALSTTTAPLERLKAALN